MNKTKKNEIFLFILVLCIIVILGDSLYKRNLNSDINEVVKFDTYTNDSTVPIKIKEDTELDLKVKANLQKGKISMYIITPDKKVIYEISGKVFEEQKVINVSKGIWYYRIISEGAEKGSYSIKGKIK